MRYLSLLLVIGVLFVGTPSYGNDRGEAWIPPPHIPEQLERLQQQANAMNTETRGPREQIRAMQQTLQEMGCDEPGAPPEDCAELRKARTLAYIRLLEAVLDNLPEFGQSAQSAVASLQPQVRKFARSHSLDDVRAQMMGNPNSVNYKIVSPTARKLAAWSSLISANRRPMWLVASDMYNEFFEIAATTKRLVPAFEAAIMELKLHQDPLMVDPTTWRGLDEVARSIFGEDEWGFSVEDDLVGHLGGQFEESQANDWMK